jgi:hypothetical protein
MSPLSILFCQQIQGKQESKIFKVTGQSEKTHVVKSQYVRNVKCIAYYDDGGNLTHLFKLLNNEELE